MFNKVTSTYCERCRTRDNILSTAELPIFDSYKMHVQLHS